MVSKKAKERARVLAFWEKHGLEAATEAFTASRRTLYQWKGSLKGGSGRLESLNEKSRLPKNMRRRQWPEEVTVETKRLRSDHPNLGKEKIKTLLNTFCQARRLTRPSESTVGNLIRETWAG